MEVSREEICVEVVFLKEKKSGRMPYALRECVPDVRTELGERRKAMSFASEALEF